MSEANNVVPVNPRPALVAGHRPTAIVPQTMDEAYRLANAVCVAGLAPRGLDTPEKAMIAIMTGLEIGLTPMAALQRIAVVNGRTTIWGDGAIGLVRASGLLVHMHEVMQGTGDAREAVCEVLRKGEKVPVLRSFSVAQAKQAGLWGKSGPWQQYPDRMLQMRARAFALRDVFADVLGGLYIREEIEEASEEQAPPARRAPPPPPAVTGPRRAPPPPVAKAEKTAPAPVEAEDTSFVDFANPGPSLLMQLEDELAACTNGEAFDDVCEAWNERIGNMAPDDKRVALGLRERHGERLS